ncbi:MAG: sigma factor-like helix-turn-helix DNA-binding protein [Lachnospiraceae bacterium]
MTIEEKKEYLKSYRKIGRELRSLSEEIRQLRDAWVLPSIVADGLPKSNGGSDLSGYAARLDELERKLREKAAELYKRQTEIEANISAMKDANERTVLRNYYLCGMTWERVAVEMGYSWQYIHKIHGRALQNFERGDRMR